MFFAEFFAIAIVRDVSGKLLCIEMQVVLVKKDLVKENNYLLIF